MKKFIFNKDPYYEREAKKYQKPIPSREYIMKRLDALGKAVTIAELAKLLSLRGPEKKDALRNRVIAMARDGQLVENRRGTFILADKSLCIRGLIVGHKDGYGFLIPEDGGDDIYLSTRQMSRVFHGDRVLVQVVEDARRRREGRIVNVLEHNTVQIVGRYFEESGIGFVVSINKNISQDVLIAPANRNGVQTGQLVVAEILTYPTIRFQATAKITEVLGEHMAPGMEVAVAIRAYGLPHEWSDEVKTELEVITSADLVAEYESRQDLRDLPFVTIDGADAKDFDDAVYCVQRPKGGWHLYVAIADVSYFVRSHMALNQEAMRRGNSVYFPTKVVPMLPEALSNDLCSLRPNEDRLCLVCDMNVSEEGKVTRYKFYEAVMRSSARLTYEQANKELEKSLMLKDLNALFQALYKQRAQRGAINFDTIATKIIFDAKHKIKDIEVVERNDAHRIIEECMLAANVCAAKFLSHNKIPALYRVHEGPDAGKLTNLRNYLAVLGFNLTGGDKPQPLDYANILCEIQNTPFEHLVQVLLLRSMRQAIYAEDNVGHFGLAYDAYAHFTSPIRRYPDLLTHRAIKHALKGGTMMDFEYDNNMVHNFGEHCSMTERRADDATQYVEDWLKCIYLQTKIGAIFPGLISGVCGFGIFVELKSVYIDGLVHVTALPNDYYQHDPIRHNLSAKRSGKKFALGDFVLVRVMRVDLDTQEIDFELVK